MTTIEQKHQQIAEFYKTNADENQVKKLSRYFKEGLDAYGIDKDKSEAQRQKWMDVWKNEMGLEDYLELGDLLISTGKYEEGHCAIHFVLTKKEEFTPDTFNRVGKWLENGIQNWAHTDVLCMIVLSEFLFSGIVQTDDFRPWTESESKWKRRAVPVTFVEAIKKNYEPQPILSVIELLMEDPEEDVQKGLGTLLREIWKKQPQVAEEFLLKWKDRCGRKIIQYATEKMDKANKARFKKSKK